MNNPPRQPTYTEQVAQWRQQRMAQQVETRKEEIKQEYAQAARERDEAIANNDLETAEVSDDYCQNLEAEWAEYHPPQPPQQHPAAIRWREANRDFVDRLISKHGQAKTDAYFNAIDQRLTAPRNLQDPSKGGMGLQRFSKEYFDRGKDFLELYSEGTSGVSYEPDATLTATEAAKISGVSPNNTIKVRECCSNRADIAGKIGNNLMASLRKKYQQQVENPPRDNDDAPVAASPRPSAAAPPPAVEHPEPPALEEERPEEAAAKSAIQERLREMTEAEAHARQPVEQPRAAEPPQHSPPRTTEEQFEQAISRFPTRIQQWCRKDPRLLHDPERIAEAQYLHHVVCREVGGEGSDEYYNRMETRLGLTPRAQSVSPPRAPTPRPAPQRFTSQPPAAPPTREVPSMRTGRPPSDSMRPTALDHEGARIAGIDIQTYMEGKRRFEAEKKAGLHGGG